MWRPLCSNGPSIFNSIQQGVPNLLYSQMSLSITEWDLWLDQEAKTSSYSSRSVSVGSSSPEKWPPTNIYIYTCIHVYIYYNFAFLWWNDGGYYTVPCNLCYIRPPIYPLNCGTDTEIREFYCRLINLIMITICLVFLKWSFIYSVSDSLESTSNIETAVSSGEDTHLASQSGWDARITNLETGLSSLQASLVNISSLLTYRLGPSLGTETTMTSLPLGTPSCCLEGVPVSGVVSKRSHLPATPVVLPAGTPACLGSQTSSQPGFPSLASSRTTRVGRLVCKWFTLLK